MRRLWIALSLVLPLAACKAAPPAPSKPPLPPPALGTGPLSWDELGQVEAWLEGPGPEHYPDERIEAELVLAEGRLKYAKQDAASAPAATISRRLASAESGFRSVLADPDSSTLQRQRARVGADETKSLRSRPVAKAATGTGVPLRARSAWGARAAIPALLTPQSGGFRRITVHHSAPPGPLPANAGEGTYADEIRRIQRYHMDQASPRCGDIGYHFLIDPRGTVYEGRSLSWQGAHAGGSNNVDNIGICMLGDFRTSLPTPMALKSLETLLEDLRKRHGIPRDSQHIFGHQELKDTACPGDALMGWVRKYRTR
jgi:hypothetical protein